MPLEPLRDLFTAVGLPPHLLDLWFTRTLRDGIALAATGDYAPFRQVAAHALRIVPGAILATAGMLLLVYALVRAPVQGWASARTIGELATAAVLLGAFAVTELRRRDPLSPFSIFRARGLAGRGCHPDDRLRRFRVAVLLPHPLHAERPALLANPGRLGLPAGHRG